ncbi:hypothetical protein A1O7_05536 [Cladophialophora yegresii CBS 114405]|uniref:Uncharacterized protein n=1 Tax=Cladophialophora yegresii CBS 114405 TaxID=1182544 RepID=W9VQV2_9EURO|nr:uncharacterized protein A1O7_05536 [Cladophialophora yegresii CBS 114405]EXJ58112.1 hypothetical protein A1O7_05536 [Cladophialophora yegresii CBS 114405]
MSDRQPGSYYASTSTSYTASSSYSSSSGTDPQRQGHSKSITETMTSNDREGTTIRRTTEETGKPTLQDETYIPPGDRQLGGRDDGGGARRIQDVTDEQQAERDREYEERIEDEYAKREGGA